MCPIGANIDIRNSDEMPAWLWKDYMSPAPHKTCIGFARLAAAAVALAVFSQAEIHSQEASNAAGQTLAETQTAALEEEVDSTSQRPAPKTEALPATRKTIIDPDIIDTEGDFLKVKRAKHTMMAHSFTGYVQDISVIGQYPSSFPEANQIEYAYYPESAGIEGYHLHTVMAVTVKVLEQYRGEPLESFTYYISRNYENKHFKREAEDGNYFVSLCQSPSGLYWFAGPTQENFQHPWTELVDGLRKTAAEHPNAITSEHCQ